MKAGDEVRPGTNAGGEDEEGRAEPGQAVNAHRSKYVAYEVRAKEGNEDGEEEVEQLERTKL